MMHGPIRISSSRSFLEKLWDKHRACEVITAVLTKVKVLWDVNIVPAGKYLVVTDFSEVPPHLVFSDF